MGRQPRSLVLDVYWSLRRNTLEVIFFAGKPKKKIKSISSDVMFECQVTSYSYSTPASCEPPNICPQTNHIN